MRYGILSDVHSNLEALTAVLKALEKEGADRILCAGDLVGYGADPSACLSLIREKVDHVVCGNHDLAVADQMDLNWFNPPAQTALLWTRQALTPEERRTLADLPFVWRNEQVTLVHGSLYQPEQFHYLLDLEAAGLSLQLQKTPAAFIGHTHAPGVFIEDQGRISFHRSSPFPIHPSSKVLVNVGSVGQPRDGDPRAAYCFYDAEEHSLEIRRVPYPLGETQAKIRAAGLPESLAQRLAGGY